MNDPTLDPRDDLASAHLDGEATPDEVARAGADPAVVARMAELAAVRSAIQADVAPDPDRRERAIATALAAFEEEADAAGLGQGDVVPISAARRGRLRWARAVGVAAAVALLAAVVPLLVNGDDDPDVTAADAADAERDGGTMAAEDDRALGDDQTALAPAPGAGGASGGATSEAAALGAALPDLGTHLDLAALRAAVQVRAADLDAAPPTDPAVVPSPEAQVCIERTQAAASAAARDVVYLAVATVAGEQVVVVVGADAAGTRSLVVASLVSPCATLADEPL